MAAFFQLPRPVSAVVLASALGVLTGTSAYTFYFARGLSYFSSDPRACMNCHIMRDQFDGWQKAPHHAVATCNDCHTPHDLIGKYLTKADNGYWHSKGFTLQDFHEPIVIRPRNSAILRANCVTCHRDMVSAIAGHGGRPGDPLDCVHCHREVGHGPVD